MILEYKIKKPATVVFDYLNDIQKFVSVHPIIYKMDNLGGGNYKVYEKIGLFSVTYFATIVGNPDTKTVVIKAVVLKVIHIEMIFILKQEGEFTLINETVIFKSFLPVKSILKQIFKKQHKQLFLNIEKTN